MKIQITDSSVSMEEQNQIYTLLKKPEFPDYSNVTKRPYFCYSDVVSETIWEHFCFCMEKLPEICQDDPYLGCYALILRHLYPLLLSTNQAKNVIAYGLPADCGAYRVIQDFMTFLQEGNALTALAQSPVSFQTLQVHSCHAALYCLDICPILTAVCNAMSKVKHGGFVLLYTKKDTLPAELNALCALAQKDSFRSCTVYVLTMDENLSNYAQANCTEAFVLSRIHEITTRVNDLQNLLQSMLAGAALPGDAYLIATAILQQIEEILLSIYDHLSDDELPVRANTLKESVINYYVGVSRHCDLTSYSQKLTQASEIFFAAVDREFRS